MQPRSREPASTGIFMGAMITPSLILGINRFLGRVAIYTPGQISGTNMAVHILQIKTLWLIESGISMLR